MWSRQELYKAGHNSTADNLVNRRIALLGEKLSEADGGTDLVIGIVRHDSLDHGWELLMELWKRQKV